MKIRLGDLRCILREVAHTASTVPRNIRLYETGNDWSHYIYLVDEEKMPDIETALMGGISITEFDGPWRVGSVSSHEGYGPLLYRLAMEWVTQHGTGRGLTRNSGETSDAAMRVWKKFDTVACDPNSHVMVVGGDPMRPEYAATTGELRMLRSHPITLTSEQSDMAWNMLTSLEIGGQQHYD